MPVGAVIEFSNITKTFGNVTAVDNLSFTVEPGRVTGFLGPNGAGKTTTLRMLLGLVAPTSGTATIDGIRYRDLPRPLQTVGAALEAASFHPGRSARNHLAVYAIAAGLPSARIDAVLHTVGLGAHGAQRVGGFSLGMRQRLGLAFTLLGDPGVLVLDEPINGLDPEGIKWIRGFLRTMADEGRTVLVSSHLLSEVQQSVDDVIIIADGALVHRGTLSSLETEAAPRILVDSPDRTALEAALSQAGIEFSTGRTGLFAAAPDPALIGHIAFSAGVELSALHRERKGLEEAFLALVNGHANGNGGESR
ncbi:ABC transporter ATP-binding protein [Cryobacterium sp. TMT2-17-1]|uniref:ABC transporter ATP-binding protein n=1 Tax=Cryobacterium sandaracinum TaxID=1259247 RepID=A0ABY2J3L5_9MICO|nr:MULTISPECIES: ABC transporter ATP-binding protein [Cryobacterium]TFB57813.1 ABC transporter ATP-binding protein [Cryobacterium sp. Sr3]TFC38254.1 ABC transporter ATP-binding protein [Cryobacterium sp. TMT2-14]TFC50078.1 ABC transporter ATP-binding protein [Cryobacterium sp. TMT2-17-1]TFC69851.1 ABC transporter ATP-binding protein [Cryobacterium sp. TMT2-4]TFC99455.1 ABC transporter ATP-binding protein [Cryobacterium sandaracinum]